MTRERLTRDELATRFHVDVRTITNWVKAGMPQRMTDGKPVYVWDESYAWREKQIREDARSSRHADGNDGRREAMAELKLRALRAEAETAELELAERRRELVTVDFLETEFERIGSKLRARLLSIPSAWEPRLGACRTSVDRELLLRDLVNELLPLLEHDVDDESEADTVAA